MNFNSFGSLKEVEILQLLDITKALATESNFEYLISTIVEQTRRMLSADGASFYVVESGKKNTEEKFLRFKRSSLILNSDEFILPINNKSIAGYVALTGKPILLDDVNNIPTEMPFTFNSELDYKHNYYTKSMLVLPLINPMKEVLGVLQLVNKKKRHDLKLSLKEMQEGGILIFNEHDYLLANALADQGAVALYNQKLIQDQKKLLESFIDIIAQAIDSKSDYTGAHCKRVPILTEMLAQAACDSIEGPFANFNLNNDEWYELRIAAGLHDCGKIVTPVHIMDKKTKLETIMDRIEILKLRFELLRLKVINELNIENNSINSNNKNILEKKLEEINKMESFIEKINIGGEFLTNEDKQFLQTISKETYIYKNQVLPIITTEELYNLSIERGTLTKEERLTINAHMVNTVQMLDALPFPSNLKNVPEIACGHHEKMDGTGYPKGIYGKDMSIPARIMAIADVFEALTANDRPYKTAKKLSETMQIMGKMKQNNHFDTDVFDLFIKSKTYLKYAKEYLSPDLIDFVDEEELLNIKPIPFELPEIEYRKKRWESFLPQYILK